MNAAAYLAKFGWKEGKGLGKDGNGIKTYIYATKKDDNRGIGSKGKEVGLAPEWDDVFKRAAANVNIEVHDDGVKLKSNVDSSANQPLVYDRFTRGATLNDQKDTPTPAADMTEEEIAKDKKKKKKAKRRAEEAAAAAAAEEEKKAASAVASDDSEKPKKRKKARTDDTTETTTVTTISTTTITTSSEEEPTKKKKKKSSKSSSESSSSSPSPSPTPSSPSSSPSSPSSSSSSRKLGRGRPGRELSDSDDERLHLYHGRCKGKQARIRAAEAAQAAAAAALLAK